MTLIVLLKLVFLFIGIMFSFVNFAKMYYKETISWQNFVIQTSGITGFIYFQWLM